MQKLNALLLLIALASALLLVKTHSQNRVYFTELQNRQDEHEALLRERNDKQVEISRLTRTEDVRRKALKEGLYAPDVADVKIIRINHAYSQ